MPQIFTARRLITPQGVIDYPVIAVEDGLIRSIDPGPRSGEDTTLTSTFFDIHTHGAGGHDVMEGAPAALAAVGRFLATRGVGQYLPTTVTAPIDRTLRSLEGIADAIEAPAPAAASPVGIHLEGPFISHVKRGVHPPADILPPSIEMFERFQEAARGHIRLMTMAPEVPGALELIRHAAGRGVRVSLGHSNATMAETLAAVAEGASSATHTFNAMRALDHREPGILGTVLDDERLSAELICDGVHVSPALVRLWLKAKGVAKGILVTDSMSAAGMPDGRYMLGMFEVTVAEGRALSNGKLAGSVLTMDRAVANVRRFTGASLAAAVGMASTNPAALLGLDMGLAPGKAANFNVFDAAGELRSTILCGRVV